MPPPFTDAALGVALSLLAERLPDLQAVYVFGSAVGGGTHTESDLDLAVLTPRPIEPVARFDLAGDLAAAVGRHVDLLDLAAASTVMRAQVIGSGHVAADPNPEARQHFEMRALSAYALLNEERAGILDDIRQRGRVYG